MARRFLDARARRATSRCSTRSSATCARRPGCVVPREAWDWAKVPDAPAADLPGRRRRRRRAGARQGPRGAQGAAAAGLRPRRCAEVAADVRPVRDRADDLDVRHDRGVVRPDAGRARGARLPGPGRRGRDGRARGSSARPTRRRPGTGSAYDACCCWRVPSPVPTSLDGLDNTAKLGLAGSPYPTVAELLDDCVPRSPGRWSTPTRRSATRGVRRAGRGARRRASTSGRLGAVVADVLRVLGRVAAGRQADQRPGRAAHPAPPCSDMRAQLGRLVDRGFVGEAGPEQLRRYPRTSRAVEHRRERLDAQVAKDRAADGPGRRPAGGLPAPGRRAARGRPPGAALRRVRWMLEEYRVWLWAQQLGTAHAVCDQRIRKALHERDRS